MPWIVRIDAVTSVVVSRRILRQCGVELGCTARPLSWKGEDCLGPEAQLEDFATIHEVIPFPARGWWENTLQLENRWHRNAQQLQEQAKRHDPGLRDARLKPTGVHGIRGADGPCPRTGVARGPVGLAVIIPCILGL